VVSAVHGQLAYVPVWLLDIDGVINALSRRRVRGSFAAHDWAEHLVPADIPQLGPMLLEIRVAHPVLEFVREVVESGVAEVRWHSTWREAAVTDLAPRVGLPSIPISVAPEWTQRPPGWWKLPAAQRVVASGRPLVWTDDDIAVYADEVGELGSHAATLLIAPDPATGLTAHDLDRIAAFLRSHAAPDR
jgi:hypothetical protein